MRAKQIFNDEYLEACKDMTPQQVVEFLNDFMAIHTRPNQKTKLISLKVEENLLLDFKLKAQGMGLKYQTQIKHLMRRWVDSE